ncbi:putative copper export protein [Paraburkholderia piptadeniae]|uniref:Copper export protein n=1 Tax=Paraburkholderia piptadeniae TaxID=1701573 RepID=A0A1N7SUW5_9BURK|nr:CopD family protein [Paraburkholderia piptadeniae]SIT51168.1 putative copper export protein [Paraburkholderia piptadeniae]
MNDGFLGTLRLAFVALQNVSFAIVVGALLIDGWFAREESPWQLNVSKRLHVAMRTAAFSALAFSAFAFWIHSALMSDSALSEAAPAVRSMVEETGFGHAWLASTVLMLSVLALALLPSAALTRLRPVIWLVMMGIALARSHMDHPVDAGAFSLPVWADWVHLLAISVWVGLVLVATYVVAPRLIDAPADAQRASAAFIQSLSNAATFAFVALFLTGAYNGWRGVGMPGNLLASTYGQLLLLKLALVILAAALGGHNRFFEMPRVLATLKRSSLESPTRPLRRFATVLHIESVVLAGVVATAAVLASSPLAGT